MSLCAQKAPVSQKNLRTVVTNNPVNNYVSGSFTPPENKLRVSELSAKRLQRIANTNQSRARRLESKYGIITEAPAGKEILYKKNAVEFFVSPWGFVFSNYEEDMIGRIVFADDNTVYIKDPISTFPRGTYMKGTIDENNVITVNLPQPIAWEIYEGEEYLYNVDRLKFENDEDGGSYYQDEENREIKFILNDNGELTFDDDSNGEIILGLFDVAESFWLGPGEYNITYTPFDEQATTLPDGVTAEDWVLKKGLEGKRIKVAFDGNDVYMGDLYENTPDGWVKGTRYDNKVEFATDQYLGADEHYGYHTYFLTADYGETWNEDYEYWEQGYTKTDKIVLTYDEANNTLTADSEGDSTMLINSGKNNIFYVYAYDAPVIKKYVPGAGALKPMTPIILDFGIYEEYGYGYIVFDIAMFDVDGNFLDPDKIHYNLFMDDELFTFYTDEYKKLEEDMTDIPYAFTDNAAIIYTDGTMHGLYFYTTEFNKLGIQVTYTADNGETAKSDIAWYHVTANGINSAKTGSETDVKSVIYTDLAGRKLSAPAKGITIKTVNYADGTVKSFKLIKK